MSEEKISETSQNEDDKKDYEAIEMLKTEDYDDSDLEKEEATKNDSEKSSHSKQVTLRQVFKLILYKPNI